MSTIDELKSQPVAQTPLLLFDCELASGAVEHWSTHTVKVGGVDYSGRILVHNLFDLKATSEEGADGISRISVTLANADAHFSQLERLTGFKGSKLTVTFVFIDLTTGTVSSDERVMFKGVANAPDAFVEGTVRLSFTNRLSLQRTMLPAVRIQRRCPWAFPTTAEQRREAFDGMARGKYSPYYPCGYSPDIEGGVGTASATGPFVTCDYSRTQCEQRGMFSTDAKGNVTKRFGGIEYVPSSILVKSYGDKSQHLSVPVENEARYNDFVPIVYGSAWYRPPIVFARNDGNLTRMEVLLGVGEISQVVKVLVNSIEIPVGKSGTNMTATGWFNVITPGIRNGGFNPDFTTSNHVPLGDPYGSMAYMSLVVPNSINTGKTLPTVDVLLQGVKLPTYSSSGDSLGDVFTNNPAWVLLDVLRRVGWRDEEIDFTSFAAVAAYCDERIPSIDLHGNSITIPRFQCNLVVTKRRSAADLIRGIRNGSALFLVYALDGRLQLNPEAALALQQPVKPSNSNAVEVLNGGWPAYEFGDGSLGFGDILRGGNGGSTLKVYSRASADSPNRFTVEFQDQLNEYQQDSLSLVDLDDSVRCDQEVTAAMTALGLPNFNQAGRILRLNLNKSTRGNVYVEFSTGLRGIGLRPGDLITVTYLREGFERQPFRIVKISPTANLACSVITAQIHDDSWYVNSSDPGLGVLGGGRQPDTTVGLPRPITGTIANSDGSTDFNVIESGGSDSLSLSVDFNTPARPSVSAPGIPMLDLAAEVVEGTGTIAVGTNLYYAITAEDEENNESQLSFIVRASTSQDSAQNSVVLNDLSFAPGTATFNVYRGADPWRLCRIAEKVALAGTYTDTGAATTVSAAPDANYDHTNFYWRFELVPESQVTAFGTTSVTGANLSLAADYFRGKSLRITSGCGRGQERTVISNTADTFMVSTPWDVVPDATSRFAVSDSGWQFGCVAMSSPGTFSVPVRDGATVQVCGRSANVHDSESAYELAPVTRHRLIAGGGKADSDVPAQPSFGLDWAMTGGVSLTAVGFTDFTNTNTVMAGTLTVHYWDELSTAGRVVTGADVDSATQTIPVDSAESVRPGAYLQIDAEIVQTIAVDTANSRLTVTRGLLGSTASTHSSGASVWPLDAKTFVVPFAPGLFGSPASGTLSYPISLPDVRVAAAELYVTNARGDSPVATNCYTQIAHGGVRTLSGGQMTMQVEGLLAIETDAVPALTVDADKTIRDVFATVKDAPTGSALQLNVKVNREVLCPVTIAVGQTASTAVDGVSLPPLRAGQLLGLDIVSVSGTYTDCPGRDLTVTIRF